MIIMILQLHGHLMLSIWPLAADIRQAAAGIPVLFTRRSIREGGESIPLDEAGVVALIESVCASRLIELVDFEMNNDPADIAHRGGDVSGAAKKLSSSGCWPAA